MTHPGRARTRKPETVRTSSDIISDIAGKLTDVRCVCASSFCVGLMGPGSSCPRAALIQLLRELRRSLRDTRGAKR